MLIKNRYTPHTVLQRHLCLLSLLTFAALSFISLPDAWSYYIDHADNTPLLIRENAPPSKEQTVYTIQDNLNLFSKPSPSSPILLPASDNFIAADSININLPIFSQFRNTSKLSRDPFANLLYANLRIKKLLKDYAETQKRASELLGSSYRFGTVDLMTGNSTYHLQTTLPSNNASPPVANQVQLSPSNTVTVKSFSIYAALNNSDNTRNNKNIVSLQELQTTGNQQRNLLPTPTETARSYSPPGNNCYYLQSNSSQERPSEERRDQASYETSGKFNLFFKILDLPSKFFDFAMEHSEGTLVTGILFLLLLSLIFGSRS